MQDATFKIMKNSLRTNWCNITIQPSRVEFPAVLLNTSTGSVESEFHTYVLPEENTQLSEFCTELTGITQDQVEAGIPLRFCLSRFSRWLKKNEEEKNIVYNCEEEGKKRCTFVTWSDWDLSVCLHYECRRKQLQKPHALTSWIDLRATYRKFYERKPNGLHGALQDVGIEFHGRQHSGLDDARNTASLAWRMMCDGCLMKITRTMPGAQQIKPKPAARSTTMHHQSVHLTTPADNKHEHGLVSHTQGISNEAASNGVMFSETSATTSRGFKIWEDRIFSESVVNVIKPKTSMPSLNGNNFEINKNCTVLPVQTRLLDQNRREESKPCNTRTEMKSVPRTFNTKDNLSSHRKSREAVTNGVYTATSSTNAKLSAPVSSRNSSHFTKETSIECISTCTSKVIQKPNTLSSSKTSSTTTSSTSSILKTPLSDNHIRSASVGSNNLSHFMKDTSTKCTSTSRISPKLNTSSSSKTPSPMNRISLKNTLNMPIQGTRIPTPSSGFKTPYAPVPYRTPGSTTPRTPLQSNHPTPSGCKITPPMCGCGRRAKRRTVVSPGPNIGRFFYSCTLGRRSSEVGLLDVTNHKKGCGYFKWESMILAGKRPLTSPATLQSQKIVKRQAVETQNTAEFTSPACTVRTLQAGSGRKRLGITMRDVIRQKNQFNKS
ncbi:ERI1 exoribonuclease 2-like isoform X2 [Asterias rubens]|uniref:ERI1 exoribonuclease 2-like isoform X2 n=1 Tax=Asterias rubens TaxID=7604 RepID=UPI0014550086|nr:ERI1 exoribonuclease 2-like isoform X2 [Asterias rubens]